MHLLLVGLSHRTAPVSIRERTAIDASMSRAALRDLSRHAGLHEVVLLSTCNRTEVYGAAVSDVAGASDRVSDWLAERAGVAPQELRGHLYEERDGDVVRHLYRVAAGLDSLVMGEPQILGQVGTAYELAHGAGVTGRRMSRLFQSAVEVGKHVRSATALGATPVSVATIALQLGKRLLGELSEQRVLVVGAGEMCEVATILVAERSPRALVVVNRTASRGEALAAKVGGATARWDDLLRELGNADLVITGTGASAPIISQADLETASAAKKAGERLVVVDMGVPRDVEAACGCIADVYLYDVDDLNQIAAEHRERRKSAIPVAEQIVSAALERYLAWQESLAVVPTIVSLRDRFEEIREAEVRQHLSKIPGLDDQGAHRVEQLTQTIINKILHMPVARLKKRAGDGMGEVLAGSLRYLFDLDENDENDEDQ